MRIYDLLNVLIEKFSPLPKKDAMELQNEAATNYHKVLSAIEEKTTFNNSELTKQEKDPEYTPVQKRFTLLEKVIKFSEQWWFKYILALLCIFLVRAVQNFLLSEPDNGEDDEPGEVDEFAEFMRWKRMRASL